MKKNVIILYYGLAEGTVAAVSSPVKEKFGQKFFNYWTKERYNIYI